MVEKHFRKHVIHKTFKSILTGNESSANPAAAPITHTSDNPQELVSVGLLIVIEKSFENSNSLLKLVEGGDLGFLKLLISGIEAKKHDYTLVRKQIAKVLALIFSRLPLSEKAITSIEKFGLIEKCVSALKSGSTETEFALIVVQLLWRMCSVSQDYSHFISVFDSCGGYNSLLGISTNSGNFDELDRENVLELLSQCLFIGQTSPSEGQINGIGFKLLIDAFAQQSNKDFRDEIKCVLKGAFLISAFHDSKGIQNGRDNVLVNFFTNDFYTFGAELQHEIVGVINEARMVENFSDDELSAFCSLLLHFESIPDTTSFAADALHEAIERGTPDLIGKLNKAGLCEAIIPVFHPLLISLKQIKAGESDQDIASFLSLYTKIVQLTKAYFSGNAEALCKFRLSPVLRSIEEFAYYEETRGYALELILEIGSTDPVKAQSSALVAKDRVVQGLLSILQAFGGTSVEDPSIFALRTDILNTLTSLMDARKSTAVAFRASGGFTWIISVVHGVSHLKSLESTGSVSKLYLAVLRALHSALSGCHENVSYIRSNSLFGTLADVFRTCVFLCGDVQQGADIMLSTAVNAESNTIEIAEIVEIILVDLIESIGEANKDAQLQVLTRIHELLSSSHTNAEALCDCGDASVQVHIITHYGQKLLAKDDPSMQLLSDILSDLCSYGASTKVAKELFKLASDTHFDSDALTLLRKTMPAKEDLPVSFLRLSNTSGSISGLFSMDDRAPSSKAVYWPPQKLSLSMWLCLDKGDKTIPLISIRDSSNSSAASSMSLSIVDGGKVYLKIVPRTHGQCPLTEVVFAKSPLTLGKWHHIVLTYSAKREKSLGPVPCVVSFYVDGVLSEEVKTELEAEKPATPIVTLGDTTSVFNDSEWSVCMSNAYVFKESVNALGAFVLYSLGPSVSGKLSCNTTYHTRSLGSFYCQNGTEDEMKRSKLASEAFSELDEIGLSNIWDGILYVILASHASMIDLVHDGYEIPFHPMQCAYSGKACVHKRRTMRESMAATGGVSLCLYILGVAKTGPNQLAGLRLLAKLLDNCPVNVYDMRRLHGYELIARFMQKPFWVLNKEILDAVFGLVRSKRLNNDDATGNNGAIVDTDALTIILLDWRIWARADDQLKIALFDGLLSLFASFPEFNIKQAFLCGIVKELLQIAWNSDVQMPLAEKIAEVLQFIIKPKESQKMSLVGAEEVVTFLLATHKAERNVRHTFRTPRVKRFQRSSIALMNAAASTPVKSGDSNSNPANTPGSPSKVGSAETAEEDRSGNTVQRPPKLHKNISNTSFRTPQKKKEDSLSTRKRVMLFDMLCRMLEGKDIPEKFFSKVLPLTNIMFMLQSSDPEIRACLLKLLSFFINAQKVDDTGSGSPPSSTGANAGLKNIVYSPQVKKAVSYLPFRDFTGLNFILTGGFDYLGIQLQSYSLNQGLLHILFRLMIGSKFPATSTTDVFITLRSVLAESPTDDVPLEHPEMARTILQVTSSQLAEYREQYTVIKAFHIMCSTSQRTLSQLLDNNLFRGIFEILLSRTTRRRQAPLMRKLELEFDSEPAAEDESDEDIMALVKTIILGPAGGNNCAKSINEALLMVNSMGFSTREEHHLQARIAGDVIKFYQENPHFYQSTDVVVNFIQISKTIMNYVWRAKCVTNTEGDEAVTEDDEVDSGEDHLMIDDTSMDEVVVGLLQLLESVLRAIGNPKYKDAIGRNISTVMDITWHMLLYIFKLPNQSQDVIVAGLRAICSKPVLAYPDPARCTAIMIYVTKLCDVPHIGPSARAAYDLLRQLSLHRQRSSSGGNGIASALTQMDMLRGNVVRAQNPAPVYFGMQNAFAADTSKIPQSLIEDAIEWDANECAAEQRFVTEQTAILERMRADSEHFYSIVQAKRLAISDKVGNAQLRAQTALYAAQADRYQREDAAAHVAWKEVFRSATSEPSPCALTLHAPFRRLAINTTYDRLGQRLRLKYNVSDPDAPTLNSPYVVSKLSCERHPELIVPVHTTGISYAYTFGENVEDLEKKLPVLLRVDPPFEESRRGGCKITLGGLNLGGDDFKILIGGRDAEIVQVSADGKEAVVVTPPQDSWGFYEVDAIKSGCLSHSKQVKYGYIEIAEYRRYMEAKYCVPLDPSLVYVCGEDEPCAGLKGVAKKSSSGGAALTSGDGKASSSGASGLASPRSVETSRRLKATTLKITQDDKVHFVSRATRISAYSELEGEVVLSDKKITFFVDSAKAKEKKYQFSQDKAQSWSYGDVYEILKRRYVLRDVGVEIFFISGKAAFFAFSDAQTRDLFVKNVQSVPHKKENRSSSSSSSSSSTAGGRSAGRSRGDPEIGSGVSAYDDGDAAEDITSSSVNTRKYTDKWVRGEMSNFEYLMRLNMLGGRTYNDLNQYPVFPFILRDYASEEIDLSDPGVFRDLSKPMGALSEQRIQKFTTRYEQVEEMGDVPYFYGTHYSSSGAVLHYLSRLEPYATYHVAFQSGRFDVPDRLFFDVAATWTLASSSPMGDVKELIPEFYTLPEMFDNINRFDFGERQDGSRVYGIRLPPWAHNDPREFVRIHRAALESEHVSAHLHEWIDLIFGCKQQSKEALNVFHPYTCEGGVDWDAIKDPVDRLAKQTQVNTWGQTPRKLFTKPHPKRNVRALRQVLAAPMVGSPGSACSATNVSRIAGSVGTVCYSPNGDPVVFAEKTLIMSWSMTSVYLTWGHWDNTLRVISCDSFGNNTNNNSNANASNPTATPTAATGTNTTTSNTNTNNVNAGGNGSARTSNVNVVDVGKKGMDTGRKGIILSIPTVDPNDDEILSAALSDTGHCLVCGAASGLVLAWKRHDPRNTIFSGKFTKLFGHTGAVVSAFVSSEHSLIATGSRDGTCILWDTNKFAYIRTLEHKGPVVAICVSPATGFVYTLEQGPGGRRGRGRRTSMANPRVKAGSSSSTTMTILHLWTVNGEHLMDVEAQDATALAVTGNAPGFKDNIVATGDSRGTISFWDADTLQPIPGPGLSKHSAKITALKYS